MIKGNEELKKLEILLRLYRTSKVIKEPTSLRKIFLLSNLNPENGAIYVDKVIKELKQKKVLKKVEERKNLSLYVIDVEKLVKEIFENEIVKQILNIVEEI